ncbi:MAG: ABC-type transport auxiliary lipoprotein family protein, partial [Desulfovibrio sp.]|nr:ABC-type transport auxiliary lipoprotein family protein [Desulfovibrio sp.]
MKILPFLALLLLPACGSLLNPGPPPARIQLNPAMPDKAPVSVKKQIVIAPPQVEGDMDADSVVLLFHGRELRHLSGVRWISPVARMLQHAIIDALQTSGGFAGVADDMAGISADARLLCDLRRFCLRYDTETGPPAAWIYATLRLVNPGSGRLMGAMTLDISIPAASTDTPALLQAMESALQQALAEIAAWTLDRMGQGVKVKMFQSTAGSSRRLTPSGG